MGYSAIREAATEAAEQPSIELLDLDRAFESMARIQGQGAERRRIELLRQLSRRGDRARAAVHHRLLLGELRQGALEGIMLEAWRRLRESARSRATRRDGGGRCDPHRASAGRTRRSGLDEYSIRLFQPVQPMLAQTAEDVAEALDDLGADMGDVALEFKLDGARVQVHKSGGDVMVIFARVE